MSNTFFTGDCHFSHKNIIRYCNRPFPTVEEMNYKMKLNWNSKVSKNDIVWHVGDFCFIKDRKKRLELINSLNGTINILIGDHGDEKLFEFPEEIKGKLYNKSYLLNINVYNKPITICHWPMRSWAKSHYGSYNLHGHTHNNETKMYKNQLNVGVDCCDFFPISFDEVREKIEEQNYLLKNKNELSYK
jgi:calcineurin-like phosphoesterase family protein